MSGKCLYPKYTLIGHSHVAAIEVAYECSHKQRACGYLIKLHEPEFKPVHHHSKKVLLPDKLIDVIDAGKSEGHLFVLSIGGAHHNVLGLTNHPTSFSLTDYKSNRAFLPPVVFSAIMRNHLDWQLNILRAIVEKIGSESFVCLQSPPPVYDKTRLLEVPGVYEEQIKMHGVMSAADRYEIWCIQSDIFEELSINLGGQFLKAPSSMVTSSGFLDKRAWRDPTHGNIEYGNAVLDQIEELMYATPL